MIDAMLLPGWTIKTRSGFCFFLTANDFFKKKFGNLKVQFKHREKQTTPRGSIKDVMDF